MVRSFSYLADRLAWAVLFMMVFAHTKAHAETWNAANNPALFDFKNDYEYRLSALPLQAKLKTIPWSETYWPSFKGSINIRWNTPERDGFHYTPPTREAVAKMTIEELSHLSPSEKYDLYMGHYTYPLWTEAKSFADPTAGEYTGLCDGWAMAAIQYAEPQAVTLPNPDGILIPFGSSDIKGLMTYASEFHFDRETVEVGQACVTNSPHTPAEISACADVNPGSMHVVLANQIGLKQQGFVTERQPTPEIWHQPTYAYEFQILGSAPSDVSGAHGVLVKGVLFYSEDLDESHWEPVNGTANFHFSKIVMNYRLDLDSSEKIIGGSWMPGSDRPDYFWLPTNRLQFEGLMAGINQLYRPVP